MPSKTNEDHKPFIGTARQKRDYLNLCHLIKESGKVPKEEQKSYLALAKQDINQALVRYENRCRELSEKSVAESLVYLEQRIDGNDNLPDSYKRYYLEQAKIDPIMVTIKLDEIDEQARKAPLKEHESEKPNASLFVCQPSQQQTFLSSESQEKNKAYDPTVIDQHRHSTSKDDSTQISSTAISDQASPVDPSHLESNAPTTETKTEKIADQSPVVAVDEARQREQVQIPTKEVTVDPKRDFQATMLNDIATFVMLTDRVNQYDILNDPHASKQIFEELRRISDGWQNNPAFMERIRKSDNDSAIRLAQDYAYEQQRSQNRTQSLAFEI